MSAAQNGYAETQNSFPTPLNTTHIINGILILAGDAGVKAIPLITEPWTIETIGEHDYTVFRLSVTAAGDFTRLADFIERLENDEPTTLVIESLLVEAVTDAPEESTPPFTVSLEIVVYARTTTPEKL